MTVFLLLTHFAEKAGHQLTAILSHHTSGQLHLMVESRLLQKIQHRAGMQDSSIIISVNNDPAAPINNIADYVITGDIEEVVPKLIKYYKKNTK